MHYYIAYAKLVLALVYRNFLNEVRLGGWSTEGQKDPTIGQYVSACATSPLGNGSICLVLGWVKTEGLTRPQNKAYTFSFHKLACISIQSMRYYTSILL